MGAGVLAAPESTAFLGIQFEKLQLVEAVRLFTVSGDSCSKDVSQVQIVFSVDSGKLNQRTFEPVHTLRADIAGQEPWSANAGPLGTLDNAAVGEDGWLAVHFTPVSAVATGDVWFRFLADRLLCSAR